MGWTGCVLKGMSQDPARGKCNLPTLTLSTDPRPRADGIQFQSTASVIGRYGAVQVIFLWPSLIGILTTVLSLVVDHPFTHMKSLKCDIAITLTVTHGRKSQSANRDLASLFPLLHWKEKRIFNNMAIYSYYHMAEQSREQKENYFSLLMGV